MYYDFLISDCAILSNPRSLDLFDIVTYNSHWVKTSWIYSTISNPVLNITNRVRMV